MKLWCNVAEMVSLLKHTSQWAIPEKNPNREEGLKIYFFETPSPPPPTPHQGFFLFFFTLPQEIPDKAKLNPWIFHKIVLNPLEIPRSKTKTPGKSTLFFLGHPWKFHFVFN